MLRILFETIFWSPTTVMTVSNLQASFSFEVTSD